MASITSIIISNRIISLSTSIIKS